MKTVDPARAMVADDGLSLLMGLVCRNTMASVVLVALVWLALAGADAQRLGGLLAGGATGIALLGSSTWAIREFLGAEGAVKGMRFGFFLVFVKYPLVGVALFGLFRYKLVSPIAFAGGFVLFQVVLVVTVMVHLRGRQEGPATRAG